MLIFLLGVARYKIFWALHEEDATWHMGLSKKEKDFMTYVTGIEPDQHVHLCSLMRSTLFADRMF